VEVAAEQNDPTEVAVEDHPAAAVENRLRMEVAEETQAW
jgi:hypothetical protein